MERSCLSLSSSILCPNRLGWGVGGIKVLCGFCCVLVLFFFSLHISDLLLSEKCFFLGHVLQ